MLCRENEERLPLPTVVRRVNGLDDGSRLGLLQYSDRGVPPRLLAALFNVSLETVNALLRAERHTAFRVRTPRSRVMSGAALLELHDRLANSMNPSYWDRILCDLVREEIWKKVASTFPFKEFDAALHILTDIEGFGPYERLLRAISGGFHGAERNIRRLVRREFENMLEDRKEGSECITSGLLKRLRSRVGQKLRSGAISPRPLTEAEKELIDEVLQSLTEREEQIIRLRFGLSGDPLKSAEVAERIGVSKNRVGQLEARAMRRLRHPSRSRRLEHIFTPEKTVKRLEARVAELAEECERLRLSVGTLEGNAPFLQRSIVNTPVEELDLSARAYNGLKYRQIRTVGDLIQFSRDDMLAIKNVGRKTLAEIEAALAGLGVSLSQKPLPETQVTG